MNERAIHVVPATYVIPAKAGIQRGDPRLREGDTKNVIPAKLVLDSNRGAGIRT